MKQTLTTLLILFFLSAANAQTTYIRSMDGLEEMRDNLMAFNSIDYTEIKGSPFSQEAFMETTFKMNSGEQTNAMTRFNYYNQEIHVKIKDKVYLFDKKPFIDTITAGSSSYKPFNLTIDGKKDYYLTEIIKQGNYSLYQVRVSIFKDEKKPKTPYDKGTVAQFKDELYYLVTFEEEKYVLENNRDVKDMVDDLGFSGKKYKAKLKHEDLVELVAEFNGQ